jgi:beta-lactamase regulating signal transducer with metallopeptidase domain
MDLDLIARTSAILLAAAAIATALRRAAPSTRHLVWHGAIVIVLLAPIGARLAPTITVPRVPGVPSVPRVEFSSVPTVPTVHEVVPVSNSEPGQNLTLGTLGTLGTIGTLLWFSFCWLLSGLSVWRGTKAAPITWIAEAERAAHKLGIARQVNVRQSLREVSPHVAGLFRSIVILPPSAIEWSTESRQAALVHELTHIRRADRRTQAMAQLACAIYWFNPLVWYASAALARERERACDDAVLRFGAKPSAYAGLLLDLARTQTVWTPATALSMARPSAIEGRLLSILGNAARTPRGSTRWIVTAMLAGVATAILGAQPQAPAPKPAEPAAKPKAPDLMEGSLEPDMSSTTAALVQALGDTDEQVREQAAMGLALTPGSDVIAPLLKALEDDDAQVREKAAIGLSFRRDPRIIGPLLTAIEDADAQVREKAAIALGASGDDRAIGALQKAMQDPDSQVREKAVAGLVLLRLRR